MKLSSQIIDCWILSQNDFQDDQICFLFQIIKFYPGNGTAPRVNCTYVVRVWGLGLTHFKYCGFESKCNGDKKKIHLQLWKSDPKYLKYSQFCASSCTSWHAKEKNLQVYFRSPENLHFRAAENICRLLSAPCSDSHTAAQPPQALSRSNSLNSKLLLRDTCLLFSAILTAGDSHFHLKNKTGAKQPVELELEHTLSSPRTTFASGDGFFTNRASLSLVLQTGWVSPTGGGLLPRERHLQPALLPLLWEKGSGGCFCI